MNCTATKETASPAIADMLDVAKALIEKANAEYQSVRLPCGSRALAFAIESGLKPKMAYTVTETARYSGISAQLLYREHDAGRLVFCMPRGCERGFRIAVDEMDRWMEANQR